MSDPTDLPPRDIRIDCSSTRCPSTLGDNPHCPECSHATYFGEGQDARGRTWRWEFQPLFGPTFLRKDDYPLKRQPDSPLHPAWLVFTKWRTEHWP
jgi:hypothetical protein